MSYTPYPHISRKYPTRKITFLLFPILLFPTTLIPYLLPRYNLIPLQSPINPHHPPGLTAEVIIESGFEISILTSFVRSIRRNIKRESMESSKSIFLTLKACFSISRYKALLTDCHSCRCIRRCLQRIRLA